MFDDLDIADFIINYCNKIKIGSKNSKFGYIISNLYLNCLMYFLNIRYKSKYHRNLIKSHFEYGSYGFMLWDVWKTYKTFGGGRITQILPTISDTIRICENKNPKHPKYNKKRIPINIRKFIINNLKGTSKTKGLLNYSPAYFITIENKILDTIKGNL